MGVRIIRGAIGSGKTRICFDEIEKIHSQNPSARCILLVPNHYSYEAERQAVERFGGTGLNNIEVLTLRRMAMDALSANELHHLTDAGKQMIIYKAVQAASKELRAVDGMNMKLVSSMQRQGFPDVADSLISEMKHYLITPEMLGKKAEELTDNKTLKNKLTALSCVYKYYSEYVAKSGCTDSNDDLMRLAERIERGCGYDKNTYIWVNRFDKLLPQQINVIEAMLKCGANVTLSITNPIAEDDSERELYAETGKTVYAAEQLAAVYGYEEEVRAGRGLSHLKNKPDLYKLLRYWTEDFKYDAVPENIDIFESRDTYSEVEHIACEITDLTRGSDIRYRDIAVMCGNEDEYIHLIEAVFGEYDIPYFTDRTVNLSDHPIAMQILSLFDVVEDDWSYDSVFEYLRAGYIFTKEKKNGYTFFAPLNQNEIDELENFVLKYGIRGKRRWLAQDVWISGGDIVEEAFGDEGEEKPVSGLDELRRKIAEPVSRFAEKVRGGHSAKHFAEALFDYLQDINLYAGLKNEISYFRKNEMANEAEQFTQIWNLILDVLNQTTAALGDDEIEAADFAEYVRVGLGKCEIRIIPSGIDQVYVGSAERISESQIKHIFAAGAKSGTYPVIVKTEGFLSDRDRNTMLENLGITVAPDAKKKMDEQYFKTYRAFCSVSEKLHLSYSIQDEEGRGQNRSQLITDIINKFPSVDIKDNLDERDSERFAYISSPKATIHRLLVNLSSKKENINPLWNLVHDWYAEQDEWRGALNLVDRADYYNRRGVMLDGDIAGALYEGKVRYSPSRINTFASCPFRYFMRYGLCAYPREEWDITPANIGTYAHRMIYDFCREVEKDAETGKDKANAWKTLDNEKRNAIIESIIDKTCDNILSSSARDKERSAAIFRRMGKTVSSAAALVQKSLSAGSFAENGMEINFEADINDNVSIGGTIDRIDTCRDKNGREYMRIIDYKTGQTKFDVVNIVNGYEMQMVIYAIAAKEIMSSEGVEADVAGVYYTAVRSEYRALNSKLREDNIKERNISDLCLDGETFAPEDEEMRRALIDSIDYGFGAAGKSEFLKISKDKKTGEIKNLHTLDEINGLMNHVTETILDYDARARGGDISINPYDSDGRGGVCSYCDYSAVCKFDEKHKEVREPEGKADLVWDRMRVKGAAKKGAAKDGEMD